MAITSKYILERGIIVAIVAMLLVITLTSFITPSPTKKEIERALNHINASERGVDLANDYLDKGEYNYARASLDESRGHIQESLRTLNNIETENEKELRQIRVIRTYAESQLNAIDARDNLAISLQRLEDVSVHLNQDDFVKARSELEKAECTLSEASSKISIADEQMSIIDGSLLPKSIGEGLNGKKADIEFLAVVVKSLQMYTNTLDKMIGMLERIQDLKYLTEINPDKYGVLTMEMPVTYYGDVDGSYLGYQIAPHNVAAAARDSFYTYVKTGNESDLTNALFLTEYIISSATDRGDFIVWENPYRWPVYNLTKGWVGSLSQAGSLKVFMLAYQATGDKRYLDVGNKTLNA
ncbi:MAG: D-glucuronyl C5-epimerase family protein, partial [Candidatus Hydrothermarchaeales archaeon]